MPGRLGSKAGGISLVLGEGADGLGTNFESLAALRVAVNYGFQPEASARRIRGTSTDCRRPSSVLAKVLGVRTISTEAGGQVKATRRVRLIRRGDLAR